MENVNDSIRPTLKDTLIIIGLLFYAWFACDEYDDSLEYYQTHPHHQTNTL